MRLGTTSISVHTFTHLAVGKISQCSVSLIKDNTADFVGRADAGGEVILHDLRCEKEDTSTSPKTFSLFWRIFS